jgi:hypothetical protein
MARHPALVPSITLVVGLAVGAGITAFALRHRAATAAPSPIAAPPPTTSASPASGPGAASEPPSAASADRGWLARRGATPCEDDAAAPRA